MLRKDKELLNEDEDRMREFDEDLRMMVDNMVKLVCQLLLLVQYGDDRIFLRA